MTSPDDVLKAAREAAAEVADRLGKHGYRARYERGQFDNSIEVRAACIAIMAERQRCAGIASRMEVGGIVETPELIPAILGQRERAKNG